MTLHATNSMEYLVQYLNEGSDQIPSAALARAITAMSAQGYRLAFRPERIAVDDADNSQKTDKDGNAIWAWMCWFEKAS